MRAATIDPILIPRERVHEWLDEEPKRMAFVQFELLEQFAQRLGFATAARQVLQVVTDLVAQKPCTAPKSIKSLIERTLPPIFSR